MFQRAEHLGRALAVLTVFLAFATPAARAQDGDVSVGPTDAVEAYMRDRGLDDLLSVYLLDRLRDAPGSKRAELADHLGKHYARLLSAAGTPERQRQIESQARELLNLVPGADSFELRLTLHKASFLLAEAAVKDFRQRLSDPELVNQAQQTFRELEPNFLDIGRRVDDRVDALERMEGRSTRANIATIRDQLGEARRLRSLAMYYAGWTQFYQALVNDDPRKADAALRSFGWLLNTPGNRAPSVETLPVTLLRYDHVARAAMACSLCLSIAGKDAEAIRWLDAIEQANETPQQVQEELWARRIEVLGRAKRWSDLQRLVDRRRLTPDPSGVTPLSVGEARLLAVITLEAIEAGGTSGVAADRSRLLEAIAQIALGDLVTRGEVGHVMNLVKQFGTTPMGDSGFVVLYVRGLRAYERAREAHEVVADARGIDADDPTDDAAVANRYMDAVRALEIAQVASDAGTFPAELSQARMMEGLSLFYAGDLVKAGSVFESVFQQAPVEQLREESIWYAIVSLDLAVERGFQSVIEQRDRLATVYMQTYPASDRAARLLLRRVDDGLLSEDQAIAVLLDVPHGSPLYETARRHVSRMMYRKYRASRGPERDYAAARFMEIAEELIEIDVAVVRTGSGDAVYEAALAVMVRVRQALDAALTITVPDIERAARLLDLLQDTASLANLSLTDIESELAYRRLQIAIARDDEDAASLAGATLARVGGPHARAGDRLLYRRLFDQWQRRPNDAELAVRLVGVGERVLDQFQPLHDHKRDATIAGVIDTIAQAATSVWNTRSDDSMRDIAIRMDTLLIDLGSQNAGSLRRLARASEAAGDLPTALSAWNTLMAGLRDGSDGWFEARVESIRILAETAPGDARAALDQHRLLYPELGPEPWHSRFLQLDQRLVGVRPSTRQTTSEAPAVPGDDDGEGGG